MATIRKRRDKVRGPGRRAASGRLERDAEPAWHDAKTRKGRLCEFNFYSGELALRGGSKDDAARLLRLAAADCPKSFAEFIAANAELKKLGTTR